MYQLRDQILINQEVVLEKHVHNYLGPKLILQKCRILFQVNRSALTISDAKFIDCHIHIQKPLRNFRWFHASLERCTLYGQLIGCDFGRWPSDSTSIGQVRNCNFLGATLDSCRFIDVEMESLELPGWPHYTIMNPLKHINELKSVKWPTDTRRWTALFEDNPPEISAVVMYAPAMLKELGGTEEQLKSALSNIDEVLY